MSKQQIRTLLTLSTAALLAGGVANASECVTQPVEGKNDHYAVHRADDSYAGYVRLAASGGWVAWVHNQGEQNTKFATREIAVDRVCAAGSTPGQ